MDWQIRIALMIVGLVVIGFIIFDFNRRNNISRKRMSKQKVDDLLSDALDSTTLEDLGLSTPRFVNPSPSAKNNLTKSQRLEPTLSSNNQEKTAIEVTAPSATTAFNVEKYSLLLHASDNKQFLGSEFLPLLMSEGLKFGDMDIFHHYSSQNVAKLDRQSNHTLLYSMANAIKPGTFDIDNIDKFKTPALVFFMTVPIGFSLLGTYKKMLATVVLLQKSLGGRILDDSKFPYSKEKHRQRIKELEQF